MTIQINDRMYLNEPASLKHGSQGTITNIKNRGSHKYELTLDGDQWGYWYPESMLSITPPKASATPSPAIEPEPFEISSGLGIGGFGSDDYNIWIENDINPKTERVGCERGGTRYDEACANCGSVTAICNDCELCEKCHG